MLEANSRCKHTELAFTAKVARGLRKDLPKCTYEVADYESSALLLEGGWRARHLWSNLCDLRS